MDALVGQMGSVLETTEAASLVTETASRNFSAEARNRIQELAARLESLTRDASNDARLGFSSNVKRMEGELDRTREELAKHVEKFAGAVRDFNSRMDGRR